MNQKSVTSAGPADPNEFPWAQIFAFIGRHLRPIAGCGLVGLIIGIVVALLVPKQWEASSLLRIGQIQYSANGAPVLVEPVAQVVARVQSRPFQDDVLRAQGVDPQDHASIVPLLRKTLMAYIIPNTNLITLSTRGFSKDQAKGIVETVQKMLIDSHAKVVDSFLADNHQKLAQVETELKSIDTRSKQLDTAAAMAQAQQGASIQQSNKLVNASNDVMLLGLLEKNAEAQRSLLDLRDSLQQRVDPARTFSTVYLGGVSIPDRAEYPKPAEFAITGLFIGLAIGLAVAGWIQHRKRR